MSELETNPLLYLDKGRFVDDAYAGIIRSDRDPRLRDQRVDLLNQYMAGVGSDVSRKAVVELKTAFLQENESPEISFHSLYHRLASVLLRIAGDKIGSGMEQVSEIGARGREQFLKRISLIHQTVGSQEWRWERDDTTFKERVAGSESAMIAQVRLARIQAVSGVAEPDDFGKLAVYRQQMVEFHLRSRDVSVVEVPPLSVADHFTAFEISLVKYRERLKAAGKSEDEIFDITGAFRHMQMMRQDCQDITSAPEAVSALEAGGDDKWGFSYESALKSKFQRDPDNPYASPSFRYRSDAEAVFLEVGEMVMVSKNYDSVRSRQDASPAQIQAASRALLIAQEKCFNAMVRFDNFEPLVIPVHSS